MSHLLSYSEIALAARTLARLGIRQMDSILVVILAILPHHGRVSGLH